jgi:hypothetical protein
MFDIVVVVVVVVVVVFGCPGRGGLLTEEAS